MKQGEGVVSGGHEGVPVSARGGLCSLTRKRATVGNGQNPRSSAAERARYAHRAFGGTFDPAHAAHRAACLLAMKRIGLDRVWWLVTPGNPLKDTSGLAPLAKRVAAAQALAHHPRIDVTDLEYQLGTHYTYETVDYLVRRCPRVRFVWIMGADNLRSFHRWQRWRGIAMLVPIAVVDRLGPSLYARAGVTSQALSQARIRNWRQRHCRNERRRRGFTCMASNRRYPRRRCGRHEPCTTGEAGSLAGETVATV